MAELPSHATTFDHLGVETTVSVSSWDEASRLVGALDGETATQVSFYTEWGYIAVTGNADDDYLVEAQLRGGRLVQALGGNVRSDTEEVYFHVGAEIIDAPAATYLTLDQALAAARAFWVDRALAPTLGWTSEPVPYDLPELK